jgi:hypothetical protein
MNLAASISHRMRKPISTFGGLVNLLRTKNISEDDMQHIVSYLETSFLELDGYTRQFSSEIETLHKSIATYERENRRN